MTVVLALLVVILPLITYNLGYKAGNMIDHEQERRARMHRCYVFPRPRPTGGYDDRIPWLSAPFCHCSHDYWQRDLIDPSCPVDWIDDALDRVIIK